ncbi:MAG: hypothetical protein ACK5QC_05180 [Bacteroidota bacterium]
MNRLIYSAMLLCFLASCAKKKIPENEQLLGTAYYPVESGRFIEYDVDSTVYNDLPISVISHQYRIKEIIKDQFTDSEGKVAYRIERYVKIKQGTKPYDSIPYTIKEVWMLNATNKSIQINERNTRYTKLIFPIELYASWNGNAFNNLGEQTYSYEYIDRQETINSLNFENVLQVKQKDIKNLIAYEYAAEKYAKNIGLAERKIINIYSNNVLPNVPIENRIEKGIIYAQKIIAYGKE